MHLLVVGDLHGQIDYLAQYDAYCRNELGITPTATLQVGDFGMIRGVVAWDRLAMGRTSLSGPTYAVHGNHEQRSIVDALASGETAIPHLTVFPRYGGIEEVGGVTVFGVGGAYTPKTAVQTGIYPYGEEDGKRALLYWQEQGEPAIDILLAHEAPTGLGAIGDPQFGNPLTCGSAAMRRLWEVVRPRWYLCGHYHRSFTIPGTAGGLAILPRCEDGAAILDTTSWRLTPVTLEAKESSTCASANSSAVV